MWRVLAAAARSGGGLPTYMLRSTLTTFVGAPALLEAWAVAWAAAWPLPALAWCCAYPDRRLRLDGHHEHAGPEHTGRF